MIPPRVVFRAIWALHKGLRVVSGGHLGTPRPRGTRLGTLFLLSTGRTSGQQRRNGLFYIEDGANLVVVASNAGASAYPGWWLNLQATPRAEVELGAGRLRPVHARAATADEETRLWPRLVAGSASFEEYRKVVDRPIPIVVLEPA